MSRPTFLFMAVLSLLIVFPAVAGTPSYRFSTYFGDNFFDANDAVALDSAGNIYVTGYSWSGSNGPSRSVVAKLDPSGSTILYKVFLSSGSFDFGSAIAVDVNGNAYVAGSASSNSSFTPVNALYATRAAGGTAFVAKLNSTGSVIFSTFLGGSAGASVSVIALDHQRNIIVGGATGSADFPTKNAFQPTKGQFTDGFITKIAADGQSLIFSTFIGGNLGNFDGSGSDVVTGLAVDNSDQVYATGRTGSPTFPLKSAMRSTPVGLEAFVTRLTPAGSLVFSTFLGGSGDDAGSDVAISPAGAIVVTGTTNSLDFPLKGSSKSAPQGDDVFVTRMAADGSSILTSVLVGGGGTDQPSRLTIDPAGNVFVIGTTDSSDFPLRNALQTTRRAGQNAFLFELTGATLSYSSYLGGTSGEGGNGIASRTDDDAVAVGLTSSTDFPTANAMQPALKGGTDGFITAVHTAATADLSITKARSSSILYVGNDAHYMITVTNNGPSTATSVQAQDTLPPELSLVSATPSQGSCNNVSPVVCNLGTLLTGATATIDLVVRAAEVGNNISNTATVNGAEVDPNPDDDASTSAGAQIFSAAAVPTLSISFLIALVVVLGAVALIRLRS